VFVLSMLCLIVPDGGGGKGNYICSDKRLVFSSKTAL